MTSRVQEKIEARSRPIMTTLTTGVGVDEHLNRGQLARVLDGGGGVRPASAAGAAAAAAAAGAAAGVGVGGAGGGRQPRRRRRARPASCAKAGALASSARRRRRERGEVSFVLLSSICSPVPGWSSTIGPEGRRARASPPHTESYPKLRPEDTPSRFRCAVPARRSPLFKRRISAFRRRDMRPTPAFRRGLPLVIKIAVEFLWQPPASASRGSF